MCADSTSLQPGFVCLPEETCCKWPQILTELEVLGPSKAHGNQQLRDRDVSQAAHLHLAQELETLADTDMTNLLTESWSLSTLVLLKQGQLTCMCTYRAIHPQRMGDMAGWGLDSPCREELPVQGGTGISYKHPQDPSGQKEGRGKRLDLYLGYIPD
jgi:hypothetical protein